MSERQTGYIEASAYDDGDTDALILDTLDECADHHEEFLTEVYGTIEVAGLTFDAGRIVRELDPIGFRCSVADSYVEINSEDDPEYFDDEEV